MAAHAAWLRDRFDEGVFLFSGSIVPGLGGAILAHGISREALEARVAQDPFVAGSVVDAEIIEISPSKADPRLDWLLT